MIITKTQIETRESVSVIRWVDFHSWPGLWGGRCPQQDCKLAWILERNLMVSERVRAVYPQPSTSPQQKECSSHTSEQHQCPMNEEHVTKVAPWEGVWSLRRNVPDMSWDPGQRVDLSTECDDIISQTPLWGKKVCVSQACVCVCMHTCVHVCMCKYARTCQSMCVHMHLLL